MTEHDVLFVGGHDAGPREAPGAAMTHRSDASRILVPGGRHLWSRAARGDRPELTAQETT
jgi:hypothetical protein